MAETRTDEEGRTLWTMPLPAFGLPHQHRTVQPGSPFAPEPFAPPSASPLSGALLNVMLPHLNWAREMSEWQQSQQPVDGNWILFPPPPRQ